MVPNRPRGFSKAALICGRLACTPQCLRKTVPTAFVVGIVLNSINQLPNLFHHQPVSVLKIALNFLVPFLVSSYSVVSVIFETKYAAHRKRMSSSSGNTGTN